MKKNPLDGPHDLPQSLSLGWRPCLSDALVVLAVVAGFGLTWFGLSDPTNTALQNIEPPASSLGSATGNVPNEFTELALGQYIQESAERSSFRPDFSSGLRRAHQRNNFTMLRVFSDAIVDARLSTVKILNETGHRVALGAIVDSDGWIVTKASQLPSQGQITALLADGSDLIAEVVQRVSDVDLALLRVPRGGLTAVQWTTATVPLRGTWLATTDIDKIPSAVGVVSAGIQNIRSLGAVLGVELVDSAAGAAVVRVLTGTGADRAGLQVGDNITAVNGKIVKSRNAFQRVIDSAKGGESIKLTISRSTEEFTTFARLMDLSEELLDETEMEVNGPVSARATGFSRVFLHDTVLEPDQCGGPLCNLDGKVVGLNIARAGRVCSYALPADVVQPLLESLIAQATLVSRPVGAAVTGPVR